MVGVALLLLQTETAIAPSPSADQRLLRPVPPAVCNPSPNEIVVCRRDADTYRLPKVGAAQEVSGPPTAEWGLFGKTKLGMHGSERTVGGFTAPAAMATIKMPF
jgi:hypothetical protein